MNPDTMNYPVKTPYLRWALVNTFDICPECGGALDTGWECNTCKYDAISLAQKEPVKDGCIAELGAT